MTKLGEQKYAEAQEDTIVCNADISFGRLDGIGWLPLRNGQGLFVQLDQEVRSGRGVRLRTPNKVETEISGALELKPGSEYHELRFYAYGGGRLLGITADFSDAILKI